MSEKLLKLIAEQQAGKEGTPEWAVGEQLKEIAAESELNAELIEHDLEIGGMKLPDAAAALKKYADEHHGKAQAYCITPEVADGILRKFYGIGERSTSSTAGGPPSPQGEGFTHGSGGFVDLTEFL